MIPGEKIPFYNGLIEAYLIESRSIGGLSGSPVFVRPTITMQGQNEKGELMMLSGVGRFYLFGSVIGHWVYDDRAAGGQHGNIPCCPSPENQRNLTARGKKTRISPESVPED